MASPASVKEEPMEAMNSPEQKDKKCFLQKVPDSSQETLKDAIFKSFLDENPTPLCWEPTDFELVVNEELARRYQERKDELSTSRTVEELEDRYGFLIPKSKKDFWGILNSGLHSAMSVFSVFGAARSGVYLYQHADLSLKNFALARPVEKDVQLMVFKFFEGKSKKFVASLSSSENKELLPDVDCHMCSLRPITTDKPELQFLKSQVFLYELDEYDFPACRPRQCVPYAIVTFTKATLASKTTNGSPSLVGMGSRSPGSAGQLRGTDRFANYPGLIDIIAGINAKPDPKNTPAPPPKSERGKSQEKSSESVRQRRESDNSDRSRGRSERTDNKKLREVIEKVNSKKTEKSSLLPIHKNWQQPNQGYQPYRQVHLSQRGGNMNPRHQGQGQMGGNMMQQGGGNMMMRQQGGVQMQQRMQNPMMQQQGGNMGFNPSGNSMPNMGMMQGQGFNQGMFGGNDMNSFGNMNNMSNQRMQQNAQDNNQFSLLNAPMGGNANQQMSMQGMYRNHGGQNMQGGWRQ